jgi:hypothetical protein
MTAMKISNLSAALILSAFATGCGSNSSDDSAPNWENELKVLDENQARWASSSSDDYAFDLERKCMCVVSPSSAGAGRFVVTVNDAAVDSAFKADTGEYLSEAQLRDIPTVDDLFEITRDAYEGGADRVEVTFNATNGLPSRVLIDYSTAVADDQIELVTTNLR